LHISGSKKDILILSSPRSGSTWLMESITTQDGMKSINEPLSKNVLDFNKFLKMTTRNRYINLTAKEENIFREYFRNDKKISHFGPNRFWDKGYKFISNRRVIKIINANPLIEWFVDNLDMQVIYLVRHPISQSLSCIDRGHRAFVEEFIDDEKYKREMLNEELLDFVKRVLAEGSKLEKFVLEWCLDNMVPLNSLKKNHEWIFITYEDMVLNTRKVFDFLSEKLGLECKERLYDSIKKPSKVTDSSSKETINRIIQGDKNYLVNKWKERVDDEKEKQLFRIIDRFGIDIYNFGCSLPRGNYLITSNQNFISKS